MRSAHLGIAFLLAVCPVLARGGDPASGGAPAGSNAEALVSLAPFISLQNKEISTFDVSGTLSLEGLQLRFMVSGRQPDQVALRILDPRDGAPVLVAVNNTFMFYDPVVPEVVLGQVLSAFVLKVEKAAATNAAGPPEDNVVMGFGFHSVGDVTKRDGAATTLTGSVIDLRSFFASLVRPLEVQTEDGRSFALSGRTRRGGTARAVIVPGRKEGPYSRVELCQADNASPFLTLDRISLNQPLPRTRLAFPKDELLASGLPTRQMASDGMVKTVLSMAQFARAVMARMVLGGLDDADIRALVERMSLRALDWDKLRQDDPAITAALNAIFGTGETSAGTGTGTR